MNKHYDTRDLLNNLIYPRLSAEIVFSDLQGLTTVKKGITATCPTCNRKAHFFCYSDKQYGKCLAGSCPSSQKAISWWDHVATRFRLKSNREILLKLAELAGVTLPDFRQNMQQAYKERIETVDDAMHLIHMLGQKSAQHYMPREFKNYLLEKRGFDEETIKKSGLLYIDREPFIKALFKAGASKELLSQTGIFTKGFGEQYKLLLPYPDENGGYHGFVGRLNYNLVPDDETQPKYKNGCGTTKDVTYNFYAASQPGNNRIIMVEGPFDAHVIHQKCGLKGAGVIALCGDRMSEQALTQLNMAQPPIVVLALDDDKAGRLSTMALIRSIRKRTFVITNFGGYKDPGDLIAAKGRTKFKECLLGAIPAYQWIFRHLYSEMRAAGAGGRLELLTEIAPVYQNLSCGEDKAHFIAEARATTLLHESDIKAAVGA